MLVVELQGPEGVPSGAHTHRNLWITFLMVESPSCIVHGHMCTSILWPIDTCQNKASTYRYHDHITGSRFELIEVMYILKLTADQVLAFPLDWGLKPG